MQEQVAVVYDASDLRALYRACSRCKRNALLICVIVLILLASSDYLQGSRGLQLVLDGLPYVLIMLGTLVGIYFYGPQRAVPVRKKYGWSEPMSVAFTEEGIATAHPNQDSLFHWSRILDVRVQAGRLFLFTTRGCAIIVPRRSFSNDGDFARWVERARTYWCNAKSVTVE